MSISMSGNDRGPGWQRVATMAAVRLVLVLGLVGGLLFLTAGTVLYWEAWVYLAVFAAGILTFLAVFLRKDPDLILRRMRTKEREKEQKAIQLFGIIASVGAYLVTGLDKRYAWSAVPLTVVLLADCAICLGYALFIRVMQENRYASRVIEVAEGQKTITTGPYAIVRHPMYAGVLVIYLFTPPALGSYWGIVPFIGLIVLLVARILNEEKVLSRDLPGYRDYLRQTRYRLIPGIW